MMVFVTTNRQYPYLIHLGKVSFFIRIVVVVVIHSGIAFGVAIRRLLLHDFLGLFLFRIFVFGVFCVDGFDHFLRVFRRRRLEFVLDFVFRRLVKVGKSTCDGKREWIKVDEINDFRIRVEKANLTNECDKLTRALCTV